MKNIWKNHKIKITALLYILAAGLIFYFVIFSMAGKIIRKSDEIQEKKLDSEMEDLRLGALDQMRDDYAYSRENSKALEVVLSKEEEVNFIKKLENIAQETGNSIAFKIEEEGDKSKSADSKKKKKDEEKTIREQLSYDSYIFIQIDLRGSYKNLVDFMNKLENTRNYVNVISLESKVEKEADSSVPEKSVAREFGIFYPNTENKVQDAPKEKEEEKYLIHSVIGIVIYTKK